MPATMKIWLPGIDVNPVSSNFARHDLAPGRAVFIENVTPGALINTCELLWVPKGGTSTALAAGSWMNVSGQTVQGWHFTVPVGCKAGSYRIKLTADDAYVIREASILSPNLKLRIPALGSRANPEASLQDNSAALCENSCSIKAADDPRFQMNVNFTGHYTDYENLVYAMEDLSNAQGGDGNATSIRGVPIDAAPPVDGSVLMYSAAEGPATWYPYRIQDDMGNATSIQWRSVLAVMPNEGDVLKFQDGSWQPSPSDGEEGGIDRILGYPIYGSPEPGHVLTFTDAEGEMHWNTLPTSEGSTLLGYPVLGPPANRQILAFTDAEGEYWYPTTVSDLIAIDGAPILGFPVVGVPEPGHVLIFENMEGSLRWRSQELPTSEGGGPARLRQTIQGFVTGVVAQNFGSLYFSAGDTLVNPSRTIIGVDAPGTATFELVSESTGNVIATASTTLALEAVTFGFHVIIPSTGIYNFRLRADSSERTALLRGIDWEVA
jgi:hypothetical protein